MSRRTVIASGLAALSTHALAAEPQSDTTYTQDFDELWQTLADRYCYFQDKMTDWRQVRARYRPRAAMAASNVAMTEIVRCVLAELYDSHTHLSNPPDGSPRWPLYDLLAEADRNTARIVAIEPDSAAAMSGLAIGDAITAIDGKLIDQAVHDLMPTCLTEPDPAAAHYALNVAVAGRRGRARQLTAVSHQDGKARTLELPVKIWPPQPDIESRMLPSGCGYIVIRSFADVGSIKTFGEALERLRNAPGLIIDVRDNGGGDTAVARPIMGRFITERRAYAQMRRREGAGLTAPWTEYVDPAGPFTYTKPVVVLTSPWSASMAEGFPMGMRDIGRATIVGTPMMGLGAAVFNLRLDRIGIDAQYSAEPVYDTKGNPRALLRPDVEIAADSDALVAGEQELYRQTHR